MGAVTSASVVAFVLTGDREASKAFYTDKLGLKLIADERSGPVIEMHGATLRIVEIKDYQAGPHPTLGWEVHDLQQTVRDLAGKGVTMTVYEGYGQDALGIWTSPDGKTKLAWFNDPDGNPLTLSQH